MYDTDRVIYTHNARCVFMYIYYTIDNLKHGSRWWLRVKLTFHWLPECPSTLTNAHEVMCLVPCQTDLSSSRAAVQPDGSPGVSRFVPHRFEREGVHLIHKCWSESVLLGEGCWFRH